MLRYFCFLIFLSWIAAQGSFGEIPSFECKESGDRWCVLYNLNLTSRNKNFKVIPHRDVSEITGVEFKYSTMEILTSNICEQLPYIEEFSANNLGLISVDKSAFEKCSKLKFVWLEENSLENLPLRLFDSNEELEYVSLHKNKLTQIDMNLFRNNPNLKIFVLNDNQLTEVLSLSEIPVMNKLEWLDLRNNSLTDLDVETLLQKAPNLRYLFFSGNNFNCDRQTEIFQLLKSRNILYFNRYRLIREEDYQNCRKTEPTTENPKITSTTTTQRTTQSTTLSSTTTRSTVLTTQSFNDDDEDLSASISPYSSQQCGTDVIIASLIHGGERRGEQKFPWVAAMFIKNKYACTVNFISRTRAVTAAHCFIWDPTPEEIKILIFSYKNISVIDFERHAQFVKVPHYDIAIVNTEEIDEPRFTPVCLTSNMAPIVGAQGIVLSWAPTPESNEQDLLSTRLSIVLKYYCKNIIRNVPRESFCVGQGFNGTTICDGDSGAGFIVKLQNRNNQRRDKRYFLWGFISTGLTHSNTETCSIEDNVIATDVTKFMSFVTSET